MRVYLAICLLLAIAGSGSTQALAKERKVPAPSPLAIGFSYSIDSQALGGSRAINVVLPAGYQGSSDRRYPVLYLLDGGIEQDLLHVAGVARLGGLWGRSSDVIVVGVETIDRRRELTGPTSDPALRARFPTAGDSSSMRSHIRDEVMPLINEAYRTNGHDAVIGESLAGLFALEAYADEPDLFDAYAAIDPSLWWDNAALSKRDFDAILDESRTAEKRVYLAMAKEQSEVPDPIVKINSMIASTGDDVCFVRREDLLHSTIYQQTLPEAIQFLFPPATLPAPELGFTVKCAE